MKITVFTSNRPRHVSLIERLCGVADNVFAVQECSTVLPGKVEDFYAKSETMQRYFARVIDAEARVFGRPRFGPGAARQMPIKMGDLNLMDMDDLSPALDADVYVVFGASFIKGALADFLVERPTFNIHMGASPYYRGSSTNFWALYDGRADYVGATIHQLTKGLDSGPMLLHAFPASEAMDAFELGMRAAEAGHAALADHLAAGTLWDLEPIEQDKSRQLRYSRNREFTDAVAADYLDNRMPTPEQIDQTLARRDLSRFVRPWVGDGAVAVES
jgi:hypothetical protein